MLFAQSVGHKTCQSFQQTALLEIGSSPPVTYFKLDGLHQGSPMVGPARGRQHGKGEVHLSYVVTLFTDACLKKVYTDKWLSHGAPDLSSASRY